MNTLARVHSAPRIARLARVTCTQRRHNASASYVPESAKARVKAEPVDRRKAPATPTYFTGRSTLLDTVYNLEQNVKLAERALHEAHLTPLPKAAKLSLPPAKARWFEPQEMTQLVNKTLSTGQYRRITRLLTELNKLRQIALVGRSFEVAAQLNELLRPYEKPAIDWGGGDGKRKPVVPDENGKVYALGRRKTSSARVWAIKIKTEEIEKTVARGEIPTATVLVNGVPAATYFQTSADRERVFRPLEVGGLLTSCNVFALVRGGGTTGQSEAIANGMAKALYALEPKIGNIMAKCALSSLSWADLMLNFRLASLTRRDPRMVERKKTNMAKARKRVRPCCHYRQAPAHPRLLVYLGQALDYIRMYSVLATWRLCLSVPRLSFSPLLELSTRLAPWMYAKEGGQSRRTPAF